MAGPTVRHSLLPTQLIYYVIVRAPSSGDIENYLLTDGRVPRLLLGEQSHVVQQRRGQVDSGSAAPLPQSPNRPGR